MIAQLHYLTQDIEGISHAQLAEEACKAGVTWVQLRVKNTPFDQWLAIANETREVCRKYNARLIINDSVAIAKAAKADGVHLGKNDMHPAEARQILGSEFIIGGTTNTFSDIQALVVAGVDYIGLGPFCFTTTKEKLSPILGVEGYNNILQQVKAATIDIPIVAIGGITVCDVGAILQTGVHGIAVSSAINKHSNKKYVVGEFLGMIDYHKNQNLLNVS